MDKKIPLKKEVYDKLESQAQDEGKTPDELASEIVTEKSGAQKKKGAKKAHTESEKSAFPAKGMVNAYGFLHLSNGVAQVFGVPRGKKTPVTIDFKDGSLIVSKV